MSNYKHVQTLKEGIDAWNQWREQEPEVKPNLSGTNLNRVNLNQANMRQTDLRKADLRNANLRQADLFKADLRNANLRGANLVEADLRGANLGGAIVITADLSKADLAGADLRRANFTSADMFECNCIEANLSEAILKKSHMISCNLKRANLRAAELSDAVLVITNLVEADLSMACLTGAKLYGTAREDWKIDGIKCDYAFWDGAGKTRTPTGRNYRPGEFEQLYCQLPTIEFIFEQGFSPFNALVMDRVIKSINNEKPEFELCLESFIIRGIPRAVFSVLHKEDCNLALEMINAQYETHRRLMQSDYENFSDCYMNISNDCGETVGNG
jgi:uncharacterized protein YjbI with pentapeptide repeats